MQGWAPLLNPPVVPAADYLAIDHEYRPDGDPTLGQTSLGLVDGGCEEGVGHGVDGKCP
jgi:hypothetical protein